MYRKKLEYFNYKFSNDELMEEFETIINNTISKVFTNANSSVIRGNYQVTYLDAQSVVNDGESGSKLGSYHKVIKQSASDINLAVTVEEKKQMMRTFNTILLTAKTFQKIMIELDKVSKNLQRYTAEKGFNEWNIVYYVNYEEIAINISNAQ